MSYTDSPHHPLTMLGLNNDTEDGISDQMQVTADLPSEEPELALAHPVLRCGFCHTPMDGPASLWFFPEEQ